MFKWLQEAMANMGETRINDRERVAERAYEP